MLIISSVVYVDASDDFDITFGALDAPTDFDLTLTVDADPDVQINWTKNIATDTTLIRRKPDSYPTNIADGTFIYNSTGSSYTDGGVTSGNDYYYNAWSFNATYHIFSTPAQDHIYVESPALFDIKNIFILDSVIPVLSIVCTVENAGGVASDITVTWVLTRVDTGITLTTGSDTFAVASGAEELYFIVPTVTYIGLCQITFSGSGASSSQLFVTSETIAGGPPGGGGGGGGGVSPPSARDSDNDGLTDAEEDFYGTNPNNPDTDRDGYTDYEEIIAGTDPLDPNSYPDTVESFTYFVIGIIAFAFVLILIYFFVYRKKEEERDKRKTTKK